MYRVSTVYHIRSELRLNTYISSTHLHRALFLKYIAVFNLEWSIQVFKCIDLVTDLCFDSAGGHWAAR